MCRLFALHSGTPVDAAFWLLDAPDSLNRQSRRYPDGFGLGTFTASGVPVLAKAPIAAYLAPGFATEAHRLRGTTFIAHVRKASTGGLLPRNTHPFLQDGRFFAHNGVVEGLGDLEQRLADLGALDLVAGDTDSERVFALITALARTGLVLREAIVGAVSWIVEHLPLYSLNLVLTTPSELWAVRYPEANDLFLLERRAGGATSGAQLEARGTHLAAESSDLAARPAVVLASERLDGDPGWRSVPPGTLIRVREDLVVEASNPFPERPVRPLTRAELSGRARTSQEPELRGSGAASALALRGDPQGGEQHAVHQRDEEVPVDGLPEHE